MTMNMSLGNGVAIDKLWVNCLNDGDPLPLKRDRARHMMLYVHLATGTRRLHSKKSSPFIAYRGLVALALCSRSRTDGLIARSPSFRQPRAQTEDRCCDLNDSVYLGKTTRRKERKRERPSNGRKHPGAVDVSVAIDSSRRLPQAGIRMYENTSIHGSYDAPSLPPSKGVC